MTGPWSEPVGFWQKPGEQCLICSLDLSRHDLSSEECDQTYVIYSEQPIKQPEDKNKSF